jgi:hypothetical protein
MKAVSGAGLDHRVEYLRPGETYTFTNQEDG